MSSLTPPAVLPATDRTRVRRLPARGVFDRAAIYAILDEAFVCHVAFAVDGQPYAIPTGFARVGDAIYVHGSAASRMVRQLSGGLDGHRPAVPVERRGCLLEHLGFHALRPGQGVGADELVAARLRDDDGPVPLGKAHPPIVPGRPAAGEGLRQPVDQAALDHARSPQRRNAATTAASIRGSVCTSIVVTAVASQAAACARTTACALSAAAWIRSTCPR